MRLDDPQHGRSPGDLPRGDGGLHRRRTATGRSPPAGSSHGAAASTWPAGRSPARSASGDRRRRPGAGLDASVSPRTFRLVGRRPAAATGASPGSTLGNTDRQGQVIPSRRPGGRARGREDRVLVRPTRRRRWPACSTPRARSSSGSLSSRCRSAPVSATALRRARRAVVVNSSSNSLSVIDVGRDRAIPARPGRPAGVPQACVEAFADLVGRVIAVPQGRRLRPLAGALPAPPAREPRTSPAP